MGDTFHDNTMMVFMKIIAGDPTSPAFFCCWGLCLIKVPKLLGDEHMKHEKTHGESIIFLAPLYVYIYIYK